MQAELHVGPADDPLERDADRVAGETTRAVASNVFRTSPLRISRDRTSSATDAAPAIVHEELSSAGQPLDPDARAYFEPRFGYDFGAVRVHTGSHAAESARSVSAFAFTVGRDVVFDSGQYAPHSASGRRLLAHELTHVVQQSAGVRRSPVLQRDVKGDQSPKRRDVAVIGADWDGADALAGALASGALIIHADTVASVKAQLAKVDFPVGTLYIITHSAPNGALQFGPAEGVIEPGDIAAKLSGALAAGNGPNVLDFRGCSVGSSPKAMQQIGSALHAGTVIAGDCFSVISRSLPVKIDGVEITRPSDVGGSETDPKQRVKRRDLFAKLLAGTKNDFHESKKCIVNPDADGYFAAGGHFVSMWFNRDNTPDWIAGKSVCYKDAAREKGDPAKTAASDHCRVIVVEAKAAGGAAASKP